MKNALDQTFEQFRNRLMLRLLVGMIAVSLLFKYINILLAYSFGTSDLALEDVAGMTLAKLTPHANWESARDLGTFAFAGVLFTALALTAVNKIKVRSVFRKTYKQPLRHELITYSMLFMCFALLGLTGVVPAETLAYMSFAPILIFAILNPQWGRVYFKSRMVIAILISLLCFVQIGSKTILFYLLLALVISAFHSKRGRGIVFFIGLCASLIYPYLNMFRGLAVGMSGSTALFITASSFTNEFASSGIISGLLTSYGAILDRIVGLDGLLVASTHGNLTGLTTQEISYELVGWAGVGISLGLLGQLTVSLNDGFLAVLAYPLAIIIMWRFAMVIDRHFTDLGFTSFATFLYVKILLTSLEGFRIVEVKLTFFTILIVCILAIGLYWARQKLKQRIPFL